jgi:hypothetical protein
MAQKKASKKAAQKPKKAAKGGFRGLLATAKDSGKPVKERVAAMAEAPLAACASDANLDSMLAILRNREEPLPVRLATLQALQAASFSVVAFESCRADYQATLREVADDPDPEMRQRVLGMLAREKDGFAEKKLLEGLKDPAKALVPPEKALQLLSYNVHTETYPTARQIVENPPNPEARREALRLLAADAGSAPLFEKLLRDKEEYAEIRQLAASALHTLQPEKMQQYARDIVLDNSEYKEIQAASLTALTNFGEPSMADDEALKKRVASLSREAPEDVKQTARKFLDKYGE